LSCKTNHSSIWISPSVGEGSTPSSAEFAGVFAAEEFYGQDMVDLQTFLEEFLNMSLRSAYFILEALLCW